MNIPDMINGFYELVGGLVIFYNCLILYRHKEVRGISVWVTIFFTTWGWWNLYYYPYLNQWLSFYGGILIVVANTLWLSMAFYYSKNSSIV